MVKSERLHHERLPIGEDRDFRCRYLLRPREQRRGSLPAEELQGHRTGEDAILSRLLQPAQPSAVPGKQSQHGLELRRTEYRRSPGVQGRRWEWDDEPQQRSLNPEYNPESGYLRLRDAISRERLAHIAIRSED